MKFIFEVVLSFVVSVILCLGSDVLDPVYKENVFYWFAYGAEMYAKRVHSFLPEASLNGIAMLKGRRLDFTTEAPDWNGALATICKDSHNIVWGVIWTVKWADKYKLDEHLGVTKGLFHTEEATVTNKDGIDVEVLTYVQNHNPRKLSPYETPSRDRLPSSTYIRVMILAAVQTGMPSEYIRYLYTLNHNSRHALPELTKTLGNPFSNEQLTKQDIKMRSLLEDKGYALYKVYTNPNLKPERKQPQTFNSTRKASSATKIRENTKSKLMSKGRSKNNLHKHLHFNLRKETTTSPPVELFR